MLEGIKKALGIEKAVGNEAEFAKKWIGYLEMSDKEEERWREESTQLFNKYRTETRNMKGGAPVDAFNMLWSNTETLAPAIYNSVPRPDCRRRFRDEDPLGKAVSEVQDRSITYTLDAYDFDLQMRLDIIDVLVCGRGLSRVKYRPTIAVAMETEEGVEVEAVGGEVTDIEAISEEKVETREAEEGEEVLPEQVEWEEAICEHVNWADFRHADEKTWDLLPWVAFRHNISKAEATKLFGEEVAEKMTYAEPDKETYSELGDDTRASDDFLTVEIWEIWNKDDKEVIFVNKAYKEKVLKIDPDPLELPGFFPIPRPMYTTLDTSNLVPIPLYRQYKQQAQEVSDLSRRILAVTKALKVRGIYDKTLGEMSQLFAADDNEMIPSENVTTLVESRGGLDKAIWMMPIADVALALRELYVQRENAKMVIYELTGISDVMRGSTNPNETLGAQNLKAQFGSGRLRSLQREVQRYMRDIVQMKGDIISKKFSVETLQSMTNLKYPMSAPIVPPQLNPQAAMALQQPPSANGMPAQQAGQPAPPQQAAQPAVAPMGNQQIEEPVTWERIMGVLRDNKARNYKVDIETDSTIAATLEGDMAGITEVLAGLVAFINGIGPAVQSGAVPIEAVKEIILSIARRARLGSVVEDALEGMQAPQAPQAAQLQQMQQQMEQMQSGFQQQLEQAKQGAQLQGKQIEMQAKVTIEQAKIQFEREKLQSQQMTEAQKLETEKQVKEMELSIKGYEAQISEYKAEAERLKAGVTLEEVVGVET